MIRVHHVLKDRTEVDDIKGHVVKAKENELLYEIINRINHTKEGQKHETV